MADFTFLFNRKGALYPLDFAALTPNRPNSTNNPNELQQQQQEEPTPSNSDVSTEADTSAATRTLLLSSLPKTTKPAAAMTSEWPFNNMFDSTLVHLCSKVIVSLPTKEINRITDIIPAELFVPLFKASLYPVKDNSIDVSCLGAFNWCFAENWAFEEWTAF
jgi:hypothetical protein